MSTPDPRTEAAAKSLPYVNNYYPTNGQMAIDGGHVGVNDVPMDNQTPFVLRSDYDLLTDALTTEAARVRVLEADLTEDLQERDIVQPCSKCAELEAAVKAVQKVDGTLSVHHSAGHYVVLAAYTSGSKVCMGRFRSKEEADAYAALLALRAGMR